MDTFSTELKRLMQLRRLSQMKVAKIIGVDQKTISNWLRGVVIPSQEKIDVIRKKLGTDIEKKSIFSGEDDFQKIVAIRNEIQKVFDVVGSSLEEIDKIINSKKF